MTIFDFYKEIQNFFITGLIVSIFSLVISGIVALFYFLEERKISKMSFCITIISFILMILSITGYLYIDYLQVK